MSVFTEGSLVFTFDDQQCQASQYDRWSFYRNQYSKMQYGIKAVDFLCSDNAQVLWLIEVKDYRRPNTPKPSNLPHTIASKVLDTLSGLVAAQCNANDAHERQFARQALTSSRLRVVAHIEQPTKPSRLFPRAVDQADLKSKLKKLVRAIDSHPVVVDHQTLPQQIPWTVAG
ncbi:MAG TPA: hypothetical protein ENJ35_01015 [Gammaproteobacteria bacterium]|nr:hypothetical protein [Gammaproteobacteria bacterium]